MGLFRQLRRPTRVIDLTESGQRDESGPAPTPELVWGLPSPCPECGDPGYLDRIDPAVGIMFQHCPSCFARWETSRHELESTHPSA